MYPEAGNSEILLKAQSVSFAYNDKRQDRLSVLHDVSFSIMKGEFLCLLGPSGCGKTTLLHLIAGLEKPTSGTFITSDTEKNKIEIGMVFQDLALFPHMSVARNIGYALRHLSRKERRERTNEMLALVGLSDKRGNYPHELSGGQKQRLALARALARQPDLILLDEPFAAQDITLRAQMRDDVMHILRKAGVSALLVTHDPEEAMQFSDRIAIMNEGRIEQIGHPVEVYNQPKNVFIASFFGQVNTLRGYVESGKIVTPLGKINAPDFTDKTPVNIVVRPEALQLRMHDPAVDHNHPDHVHTHATISEQKYLGRSTLIHLDTHDIDHDGEAPIHLHARVPGVFSDKENNVQDIFLDQSQIFIFEDEAA